MSSETGDLREDIHDGKRKRNDKLNFMDLKDKKKRKANICRDFLRNVCDRGAFCKYAHPDSPDRTFAFCHDFQNGYCFRGVNCRFIHSSYEDEQTYLTTKQLPSHLHNWYDKQQISAQDVEAEPFSKKMSQDMYLVGNTCGMKHIAPNEHPVCVGRSPSPIRNEPHTSVPEPANIPYCKDHFSEGCFNFKCRLKHITRNEYQVIEGRSSTPHNMLRLSTSNGLERRPVDSFESRNKFRDDYFEQKTERTFISENDRIDNIGSQFENAVSYQSNNQTDRNSIMLEEENIMLRERITELKKRIDELQITNEFLLEQNARLRLEQDKNAAGLTVPTMAVPAVTINSVPTASQIQQSPTPQQMVTATLRTVTANVATVPVSISTVTPVSLSAVSMAPVQQMTGSVMTIAQQSAPPSDAQIASQALPLSISAPSVPLVSYPIVSRTVMQPSAPPPPPNMRH